jgi:hypothetical protein
MYWLLPYQFCKYLNDFNATLKIKESIYVYWSMTEIHKPPSILVFFLFSTTFPQSTHLTELSFVSSTVAATTIILDLISNNVYIKMTFPWLVFHVQSWWFLCSFHLKLKLDIDIFLIKPIIEILSKCLALKLFNVQCHN